MSHSAAARDLSRHARRALAGFVGAMKLGFDDITFSIDIDKEEGVADSGDLDTDLTSLLQVAGEAARARGTALVLFIDEMQYVEERQLGALIAALHRTAQRQLPVTLIGSGVPQLVGHAGSAKSYAERMFSFPEVSPLSDRAAARAVEAPAKRSASPIRQRPSTKSCGLRNATRISCRSGAAPAGVSPGVQP